MGDRHNDPLRVHFDRQIKRVAASDKAVRTSSLVRPGAPLGPIVGEEQRRGVLSGSLRLRRGG